MDEQSSATMVSRTAPDAFDIWDDTAIRQDTSELDRFTICRMCDDRVCTNCPLPTTKSKRDR
jgi:hypothetical protein